MVRGRSAQLERLAEVPLEVRGNVPVVMVEINGHPAAMVLDTGSDATVLNRAAARRLGVAEGAEKQASGAGGRTSVNVARVDQLVLGGLKVGGQRVLVADAPMAPLDSGASLSTLSLQSAEDMGLGRQALARLPQARGQALNPGGFTLRRATFKEMVVGTDRLLQPTLTIGDLPNFAGDLLVGEDYIGTRRMWFHFLLGRVFVQG